MPITRWRWWAALAGLAVCVFSVVALSGPGRIEIVDGETRYEVARSLVEHGDPAIRDPDVWFAVFPGRDGRLYTTYRLPQSAAGAVAIIVADATGPATEARRKFFFTLVGAAACGLLALCYATWFRQHGHSPKQALLWAMGGILCTPAWFYGASTFDDVLGALAVVLAIALAAASRELRRPALVATLAGLALGIAFNCKQPLGVFVLPVLAASHDPRRRMRAQTGTYACVLAGLTLGLAVYFGYRLYCFPPGTMEANAALAARYGPVWSTQPPLTALAALLFSAGTGVLLYCPPLVLSVLGVGSWWRSDRDFCAALLTAAGVFTCFIACLTFFKGDPAWGPRYLTPVIAALWLIAPAGARVLRRHTSATLLALGAVVQLLALSVDPIRLYIEQGLPVNAGRADPAIYFNPRISHLFNRPREILQIATRGGQRRPDLSISLPTLDSPGKGSGAVVGRRVFRMPNTFRPWWATRQPLGVDSGRTALLLIVIFAIGIRLQTWGAAGNRVAGAAGVAAGPAAGA